MMGRNYKSIVRKLVEAGEIECDGRYWPGDQQIVGKCLGYRLAVSSGLLTTSGGGCQSIATRSISGLFAGKSELNKSCLPDND